MLNNQLYLQTPYQIFPCGDHAVTVAFSNVIDKAIHQKVMALFHHLANKNISGLKDIIPAYSTLTLVYDIMQVKKHAAKTAFHLISAEIENAINQCSLAETRVNPVIEIPVCYDAGFGKDLPLMAHQKGLPAEEIIRIHTSIIYDVYMLGFLPGFAYMGIVDKRIALPRHAAPRRNIPAGSVGIADNQTGIYPFHSPGGWNIIGRTPSILFDAAKSKPCLLQPGDLVQFTAVSKEEFHELKTHA